MLRNWSQSWMPFSETLQLTDTVQSAYQQFARERIIIMSAPNGARRMPDDHAELPLTPAQLAECAASLAQESVSVIHMHVRDNQQQHTLDPDRYRDAIAAVRQAVGERMIVQITTEAVGRFKRDEQMFVVKDIRPEAVSLALRELCPDESSEAEAARFFAWLVAENIWPQYILYSVEDVLRFGRLRQKGFFSDDHPFCMFVLGQYTDGQEGEVAELIKLLEVADVNEFPWSVCCFGKNENAAALYAASHDGHVRLGFENNVLLPDGSEACDNVALIAAFHASRGEITRSPATSECDPDLRTPASMRLPST